MCRKTMAPFAGIATLFLLVFTSISQEYSHLLVLFLRHWSYLQRMCELRCMPSTILMFHHAPTWPSGISWSISLYNKIKWCLVDLRWSSRVKWHINQIEKWDKYKFKSSFWIIKSSFFYCRNGFNTLKFPYCTSIMQS